MQLTDELNSSLLLLIVRAHTKRSNVEFPIIIQNGNVSDKSIAK